MNNKNLLTVIIFTLALTLAYKLGQSHELLKIQSAIFTAYESSSDTDYFIPNTDIHYGGEIATGRCFTPDSELLLLQFYPKLKWL